MITASVYLAEATMEELLAEVQKRFEALTPVPAWAANTVFAVTAYHGMTAELLRSNRRTEHVARCKHLTIALLAKSHRGRSRGEICAVVGLDQRMYVHALSKIEDRCQRFPDFRSEVAEILQIIRETSDGNACRRTSPRGTSGDLAPSAPTPTKAAPPSRIAS